MVKFIFFKINQGDFERGFEVTLQIAKDNSASIKAEIKGNLPPFPDIPQLYKEWRADYLILKANFRARVGRTISDTGKLREKCLQSSKKLKETIKTWLQQSGNLKFREIRERLGEEIHESRERGEEVRLFLQTEDELLKKLPWTEWDLFYDKYTKAEVVLSPLNYEECASRVAFIAQDKVRILAILGDNQGINVQADREFLQKLPGTDPLFLSEPKRAELSDHLWEKDWDILFFAGHSLSESESGRIYINSTESLTVKDLKHGLKKSIERNLHIAIFNSCDGLKLASDLAELNIPQVIVMREPVPDRVAQQFLKHFLTGFASGKSLYLAVREARERLYDEGLDDEFPGAAGLAVICQNPAEVALSWLDLGGRVSEVKTTQSEPKVSDRRVSIVVDGTWKCVYTLDGHSDSVRSVAIDPNSEILASGSFDTTIKLWHLGTGELIDTIAGHSGAVMSLAFSPDGQTLASCSAYPDGTIKLWHPGTRRLLRTLKENSLIVLQARSLAFSPDGQILAIGCHCDRSVVNSPIKLWHLPTGVLLHTLNGHIWGVWSVAFTPDGRTLASGSWDGTIKLWELRTKELKNTLNGSSSWFGMVESFLQQGKEIQGIAISPDGQILASGGKDKTIKLWRLNSGELRSTLTGHSEEIFSVAISPDGQTVASGSADNTIRIWNLHTEKLLCVLTGHSDTVYSIAFSPDGQTLVSGSADMTLKIWRISS
ncbi:CHAT domain-containing protein [Aerosakkonema funiforme]|uniref:CHAT domain-containing protein n=1 Tax=Aerosakkonema funiforme TaxID=1246630 RepID=UPI0035B728D8